MVALGITRVLISLVIQEVVILVLFCLFTLHIEVDRAQILITAWLACILGAFIQVGVPRGLEHLPRSSRVVH